VDDRHRIAEPDVLFDLGDHGFEARAGLDLAVGDAAIVRRIELEHRARIARLRQFAHRTGRTFDDANDGGLFARAGSRCGQHDGDRDDPRMFHARSSRGQGS
jgi:hypothetical protein